MDLLLAFNPDIFGFDLALAPGQDLQGDDGLLTAVIISLFTDARAAADDPLPDERIGQPSDLRGWWGDALPEAGPSLGSRLWLLSREKELPVVVARAQQYAEEALAWLLSDGQVSSLNVFVSGVEQGHLGIDVQAVYANSSEAPAKEWSFVYDYKNTQPVSMRSQGV